MSRSPYAPPASSYIPQSKPGKFELASKGQRFANFFVDGIIVRIISFCFGLALGVVFLATGQPLEALDEPAFDIIAFLIGLCVVIGYYFVTELALDKTLAKFLTGTRVVSENGGKPTAGQILGRSAARLIPFEPFSVLFHSEGIGWHDSLSGTRVVRN